MTSAIIQKYLYESEQKLPLVGMLFGSREEEDNVLASPLGFRSAQKRQLSSGLSFKLETEVPGWPCYGCRVTGAMSVDISRTLPPHLPPRGWAEPRALSWGKGGTDVLQGKLFPTSPPFRRGLLPATFRHHLETHLSHPPILRI